NKLGKPARSRMEPWDVTIVGGGVLGTSIAYWLAQQYDGRIAVLEKEVDVAAHTSRRNTGVVHRPFYLDPVGRKVFARCAQVAYGGSRRPGGATPEGPGARSPWGARSAPAAGPGAWSGAGSPPPRRSASTSIPGGRSPCASAAGRNRIGRGT